MSRTIRSNRRRWYSDEVCQFDGVIPNIYVREPKRTGGHYSDEDTNNKRAMNKKSRRQTKALCAEGLLSH